MRVENWALVYNSVLSPRLANQLLFGFNYFDQVSSDANTSFNPTSLGLNTGVTNPQLSGAPRITIGPFDPIGATPRSGRQDTTWHLTDALGLQHRQTSIALRRGSSAIDGGRVLSHRQRGTFISTASRPLGLERQHPDGNVLALADFLAGYVYQSSIVTGDPARTVYTNGFSGFVQDNFQVTRKLNINFGLRYDYNGPIHDGKKIFRPSSPAPEELVLVGDGNQDALSERLERLGASRRVAYQPFNNAGLVVRGASELPTTPPTSLRFWATALSTTEVPPARRQSDRANPVGTLTLNNYTLPRPARRSIGRGTAFTICSP